MEAPLPLMSVRKRWLILSIAIPFVATGSPASAGPWNLAPGEFYSEIHGGWFSSDTYHPQDGSRAFLAGGGLWEQRSVTWHSELGWKPKLNFIFELPIVSVSRELSDRTHELPTQTGLGDAILGLRYRLKSGRSAAAVQLDWKAPLSYERDGFLSHADSAAANNHSGNSDSLDANALRQLGQPVLGDGQSDLTFALQVGTGFSRGFFEAAGGYKYRFEKPKDQIVLSADLGIWVTRTLMLAGRYEGEMAKDGERPTDEPDLHRVGPLLVYRFADHMDLFVGSMHTASAENALHTDEVHVGFAFRQTKLNRIQGFLGGNTAP